MIFIDGKPAREPNTNGLFVMDEEMTIVKKGLTPIQRQRAIDGTPHTITGTMAIKPDEPELYLEGHRMSKSVKEDPKPAYDPDAVVKAYLAY